MTTQITVSDEYTGSVTPDEGAPAHQAQRRTLDNATIVKMSVGDMDNNVYLVTDSATGRSLLIDAANDADAILALVETADGVVEKILTTHWHPDHWQALQTVHDALGVPTAVGRKDAEHLPVPPDVLLDDGDTLMVGDLRLAVIALRGHTEGSVALALTESSGRVHLFTGDSLFPGGVGKTWQPGDFEILLGDVETKLFGRYRDDTAVYPGHGADTTLGAERADLPAWRARGW